jgi:hypothetical protein
MKIYLPSNLKINCLPVKGKMLNSLQKREMVEKCYAELQLILRHEVENSM